jgi:hypothetical protein
MHREVILYESLEIIGFMLDDRDATMTVGWPDVVLD